METAAPSFSGKVDPVVRQITRDDVIEALALGLRDFQAAPKYGLVLGGVCSIVGLAIILSLYAAGFPYLAYPMAAGFAIVCPWLAAGLYEVSRRLERGEPISAGEIWRKVKSRSEVRWMGFATLFILILWMYQVRFLMAVFLGMSGMSASLSDFFAMVLGSNEGLAFLAVGNMVGAALATVLFSISVVAFPLVLDRDVDFVTAMITSVRAVSMNPGPMFFWAAIIVLLLVVSILPLFLGLLLTLPVLGHATWHLYRRVVVPLADEA